MTIEIDSGNALHVIDHASSDAVTFVFVNALTGTTDHWEGEVAPALRERGFGTVSWNFRGQPGSPFADVEITDRVIVEDLGRVLEATKPARPVLVGLSIGGLYAARAHLEGSPSAGLVLLNTLREIGPRIAWVNDALPHIASTVGPGVFTDVMSPMILNPEALAAARSNAFKNPYEPLPPENGIMNLLRNSPATDWDAPWDEITVPTLVITGHHDRVFRDPEVIDRLASGIVRCTREEWEDCGHMVPVERPGRLIESLARFGGSL